MEVKKPPVENKLEIPSKLQELLPCGYSYKLKKWTAFENKPNQFEAVIFTNVYTEDEAQEWWYEFNAKSNTTMRVRATCPKTGKVNTFKIYLRCLHQGRTEKAEKNERGHKLKAVHPTKRNTNCPAGMIIAIRRLVKYSRSKLRDPVDPVHPCEIQLRFVHNHSTNDADSLRFRPVSKDTEQKLINLYQIGHSPSSALETLKFDLLVEHGAHYSQVATDRRYCPDKPFCYRLYYKHFGKEFIAGTKKDLGDMLDCKVKYYNNLLGDMCLAIGLSGTDHVIALCTPLMKRAHSLPQSGDMVYVEVSESPSGNKERVEHDVFLLVAHTPIGGVPLGCILVTNNSTESLELGFRLLKEVLPANAFYGKGEIGPHSFSIPDSENLRMCLNISWPSSDVIVCIFRLLQTMWLWLWDEKHNVLKDHRLYLLYLVKTLLFASDEAEMSNKYQDLCTDSITVHYPLYLQQVESIWQKRPSWGICFHGLLTLQGASNYYEAAVRALKDKLLEYPKMFNIVQLLDFLVTRLDLAYKNKFLNILQNELSYVFHCHFAAVIPSHVIDNIEQIAGNYFLVPGELGDCKIYTVDAELNTCSCPVGVFGILCIHQYWIFLKIPSDIFKVTLFSEDFRQKMLYVATESPLDKQNVPTSCKTTEIIMSGKNSSNIQMDIITSNTIEPVFSNISSNEVPNSLTVNRNLSNFPKSSVVLIHKNTDQLVTQPFVNLKSASPLTLENVSSEESRCAIHSEDKNDSLTNTSNTLSTSTDMVSECIKEDMEINRRKGEVLQKFEKFCQRVKDGLEDNTEVFLPALEIMMKNLERKGNTSESLISGLSFFGVLSAPSLCSRVKKRPPNSGSCTTEEIMPKIYGRQMNTYGKKRSISPSNFNTTDAKVCSNKDADTTLRELTLTASENR